MVAAACNNDIVKLLKHRTSVQRSDNRKVESKESAFSIGILSQDTWAQNTKQPEITHCSCILLHWPSRITMLLFCSFYQSPFWNIYWYFKSRMMLVEVCWGGQGSKIVLETLLWRPGFNAAKAALGVYLGFGTKKEVPRAADEREGWEANNMRERTSSGMESSSHEVCFWNIGIFHPLEATSIFQWVEMGFGLSLGTHSKKNYGIIWEFFP